MANLLSRWRRIEPLALAPCVPYVQEGMLVGPECPVCVPSPSTVWNPCERVIPTLLTLNGFIASLLSFKHFILQGDSVYSI